MKKTAILATAIAAVIAAPLATAAKHEGKGPHVTIYGAAHISFDSYDDASGTGAPGGNFQLNSRVTKIGFKGSEDLGNGMTVKWQMEQQYNLTDVDAGRTSVQGEGYVGGARNSWVGLAGDFGEVRMGRHDAPSKAAFYAAGNETIGDSMVDINTLHGFAETRANDTIAYIAPKMGALGLLVSVHPGEGSGAAGARGDGIADGTSVGVTYNAGGIKVGVGILDIADFTGTEASEIMNIGGSYTMGDIQVGLQYQTTENQKATPGAAATEVTRYALVGKFKMGANTIALSFGNEETEVGGVVNPVTGDNDSTGISLAHALSKRTTAYVGFASSDVATREGFTLGLNHKF